MHESAPTNSQSDHPHNGQAYHRSDHTLEIGTTVKELEYPVETSFGFEEAKAELERLYSVKDQFKADTDVLDRKVVELVTSLQAQFKRAQLLREAVSWLRSQLKKD